MIGDLFPLGEVIRVFVVHVEDNQRLEGDRACAIHARREVGVVLGDHAVEETGHLVGEDEVVRDGVAAEVSGHIDTEDGRGG